VCRDKIGQSAPHPLAIDTAMFECRIQTGPDMRKERRLCESNGTGSLILGEQRIQEMPLDLCAVSQEPHAWKGRGLRNG